MIVFSKKSTLCRDALFDHRAGNNVYVVNINGGYMIDTCRESLQIFNDQNSCKQKLRFSKRTKDGKLTPDMARGFIKFEHPEANDIVTAMSEQKINLEDIKIVYKDTGLKTKNPTPWDSSEYEILLKAAKAVGFEIFTNCFWGVPKEGWSKNKAITISNNCLAFYIYFAQRFKIEDNMILCLPLPSKFVEVASFNHKRAKQLGISKICWFPDGIVEDPGQFTEPSTLYWGSHFIQPLGIPIVTVPDEILIGGIRNDRLMELQTDSCSIYGHHFDLDYSNDYIKYLNRVDPILAKRLKENWNTRILSALLRNTQLTLIIGNSLVSS